MNKSQVVSGNANNTYLHATTQTNDSPKAELQAVSLDDVCMTARRISHARIDVFYLNYGLDRYMQKRDIVYTTRLVLR